MYYQAHSLAYILNGEVHVASCALFLKSNKIILFDNQITHLNAERPMECDIGSIPGKIFIKRLFM